LKEECGNSSVKEKLTTSKIKSAKATPQKSIKPQTVKNRLSASKSSINNFTSNPSAKNL
jgi:hypothetical protein